MLVPHGAAIEFARPGFAAVAHHFGWLHTPADFKAHDPSPSASSTASQSSAARNCAAAVASKRHGPNRPAPACPDHGGRQPVK
jgi:hypothetical protein